MDYITLKRFEFDKILEQSPDIPENIIKEFNQKFKNLSIHKPDPTIGLQTIIPFGDNLKILRKRRFISIKDKIILLRYFRNWRLHTSMAKQKQGREGEVLIEVTNSRSSDMDISRIEVDDPSVELTARNADYLMIHGRLSEQKRFIQNQNVKIRHNPIQSGTSDSTTSSESLKE